MSLDISDRNQTPEQRRMNEKIIANMQNGGCDKLPSASIYKPSEASKLSEASTLATGSDLAQRIYKLLKRFIGANDDDLKMLAIWCLHTWMLPTLKFTPRLLIDSAVFGAGKSTLLSWLKKFCYKAVLTSSLSSVALLVRLADAGNTLFVDEADRALNRDNPLTADFLAIVNQGYKDIDSVRPTLVSKSGKAGDFETVEFKTFCAAAFAGNSPNLPPDTENRCIRVFLYPDDSIEESDWELLEENEPELKQLPKDIAAWAESAADAVHPRPDMPEGVKGRFREIWLPLARVAQTQSGDFLEVIRRMAAESVEQSRIDAEEGLLNTLPHIALLKDIARLWANRWRTAPAVSSSQICSALAKDYSESWGTSSQYGKKITGRRLAQMLKKVGVRVGRFASEGGKQFRGYGFSSFERAWSTFHIWDALEANENIVRPQPGKERDTSDA